MSDKQPVSFNQLLALEGENGTFSAQISEWWSQGRAAFGGLVAAQLARALERVVPAGRPLRSALIDFLAPANPGTVTIQASVLRTGKSLVHAEARMLQGGGPVALFIGTYGAARNTTLHLVGPKADDREPPETLHRLPYVDGAFPRFTQFFDYRLSGGTRFHGSSEGKLAGYVRHAEAGPVDAAGLLALIDAWPPAVLPLLSKPAPTSSVTWMVDFVGQLPAQGSSSHAFYRYEAEALAAQHGYGSCEARLWGPDGALLAASRQLVVEFS